MRLAGSMAPEPAAGPLGQLVTARAPARIADRNDVLSCGFRPGISFALTAPLSDTGAAAFATLMAVESFATSPAFEPAAAAVESDEAGTAPASCFEPHEASAISRLTPITYRRICIMITCEFQACSSSLRIDRVRTSTAHAKRAAVIALGRRCIATRQRPPGRAAFVQLLERGELPE